jgi:hypothetical protein
MIRVSKVIVEHHTHLILHIGISSIHEEELSYIPVLIVTGPIKSISTILR